MSAPRAIEYQGVIYVSRQEAARQTGATRKVILRDGKNAPQPPRVAAVPLETAQRVATGAREAAQRIAQAVQRIREIAHAQQIEGVGTAVEIRKRRKGLIKAIFFFRQRYGVGIGAYL